MTDPTPAPAAGGGAPVPPASARPGLALGDRVRRGLERLGIRTDAGRDAVAAVAWAAVTLGLLVVLLALAWADGTARSTSPAQGWVVGILAVAQCAPLAARRRHPRAVLLAVSVLQAGLVAALPPGFVFWAAAPVVAAYTVGVRLPVGPAARIVAAALGIEAVGAVLAATAWLRAELMPGVVRVPLGLPSLVEAASLLASGILIAVASAAVGSWVALRRRHDRDVLARAVETVEHQAALTRAAVAAERTRMARELHDVAAHHLTALVVQAGAAERLVDLDPERARESLRGIRVQGRETLDALRSIVGILRQTSDGEGGGDAGTAPVPGLADLPGLVAAARTSGTEVEERATGDAPALAPLADVTAYRTVQEALANARRHAPGSAVTLTTEAGPARIALTIENALPAAAQATAPGYGLVGMRERAALVGGRLEAGPTASGTWRVRLELPVEPVPAAPVPAAPVPTAPVPAGPASAQGADA
ncbi:sensor histidine kinase [Clavibacter sepedonicus]|uniref:histidine kinase n=2 Tax=Clavibacter TaxID=1573 RepID=B0RG79_CLASE|nr:histidine kinase [Clavibacter sepedonicus]OQJ47966.1 two-component sensor histidine kinase [Clavibacter sepedonicus]OQJ53521.1 two-component sensor histidine kinase [Clavibacter sepedonicus]UUK66369.1 two-component sensor histidine kinase [Clavibacter sepedonicus]CAQ02371.1 putative two-component system sensor kinase [Clavibacter sepedonicus]